MMTDAELMALEARNEYMANDRMLLEQKCRVLRHNAELVTRFARALPDHAINRWPRKEVKDIVKLGLYLKVTVDDLPALRREFGRCQDTGEYTVENASENTVRVRLDLGPGPFGCGSSQLVQVYYVKTLPEDAPCQIHAETYVTHSVVCGVRS